MSHPEQASIPAIDDSFSDDDFATATERVRNTRERALRDPHFAATVESKREAIDRRVSSLAALRKARGLTQAQLSDDLDMSQGEISRLERRENLHLATLARFIEATGGQLRITAVYDNDEVDIGFGDAAAEQAQ